MLKYDELNRELAAGRILHGFTALTPNFPPTFKRSRQAVIRKTAAAALAAALPAEVIAPTEAVSSASKSGSDPSLPQENSMSSPSLTAVGSSDSAEFLDVGPVNGGYFAACGLDSQSCDADKAASPPTVLEVLRDTHGEHNHSDIVTY